MLPYKVWFSINSCRDNFKNIINMIWPINTQQKKVPFRWILLMGFPALMSGFVDRCSDTAMTFTICKFTDDPVKIALLGSMNILFGITIAPMAAYYSDHYSGRWGHRKPFIVCGLAVAAISLVFVPLASSLFVLSILIVVFYASMDFGYTGIWDPLYADIVPDCQRGRGMVVNRYMAMAARMLFMFFLIGKFSDHIGKGKIAKSLAGQSLASLTGEHLIYLIAVVGIILTILFVVFGIQESTKTNLKQPMKFQFGQYLQAVFESKEHKRLFFLIAASSLMTVKLRSLMPLLFTEQFQYTKQTMGLVHGVTMSINAFLVLPLAALLSDRINRYKLFVACLVGSTLQPILFWGYVYWINPIPSPAIAFGFHVFDAGCDHLALIALWPLLYESSSLSERGSLKAGFLIIGGCVSFLLSNLLAFWIKWFTQLNPNLASYDYMSGYLLIFLSGIIACVLTYCGRPKKVRV